MKIKGNKVILRSKKPSDAENDFRWQADEELSALDAMEPITMSFQEFYREYIYWLKKINSNRITFAVETTGGKHIGNCVYYNIDWFNRETEIGIMIGDHAYWHKGYGTDTINTLIDYIFQRRKFKRVHLKTLEANLHAQHCFKRCGLKPCGHIQKDGYKFLQMDMSYSHWNDLRNVSKQD